MKLILFPTQSRAFPGQRWLSISLRTLHLIGLAGVGAGFLFQLAFTHWQAYLMLIVLTGLAMVVLEIWSNGIWLLQLRGLATMIKLLLLSITLLIGLDTYILITVIIISAVLSHAPGKVRYYSLFK